MLFLFGINFFELKSFSFEEMGLPALDARKKYTIDVIERYFHIFEIPVFSLGKQLKLGYFGDYSAIPANLESQIDREKAKVPGKWYSFSGLFILMLISTFFLLDKEFKRREEVRMNELYQKEQELFLKNPQIGDRYYFTSPNLELQAEIHAISNDSLLLTIRFPMNMNELIDKKLTSQQKMDQLIALNEWRNLLNDSLDVLFPREPLLADVLALGIIDSTSRLTQLWVERREILLAYHPDETVHIQRQKIFLPDVKQAFCLYAIEREKGKK